MLRKGVILAALAAASVYMLIFYPTFLLAIVALGLLILVHELGHLIAAKHCGVWVECFSIGFGPKLLSKTKGDTEYCLSLIPLGGYAKYHRMVEEEPVVEGREEQAFFNKPYGKKIYMVTAGVIFNILFAVLLFAAKNMIGYPAYSPVVYSVQDGSAAASAGFLPSDKIISAAGGDIKTWGEFLDKLTVNVQYPIEVKVERDGNIIPLNFTPDFKEDKDIFGDPVKVADTGLSLYIPAEVGSVVFGMPAESAGIMAGDIILSINGAAVSEWKDVGENMRTAVLREDGSVPPQEDIQPLTLQVAREGEVLALEVTPKVMDEGSVLLGISAASGDLVVRELPHMAVYHGFVQTAEITKMIFIGIGKLITGQVSRDNLGGPIMILAEGANSAKAGFGYYILFIALISINLGILNILPIPIVDGGYVVLFTVEKIMSRKIGRFARECFQTAGIALLGLLMVFAMYNDIVRFFFK
ncbi:MAG: RIP metalloprotease RseP [Deferribacteraceae bacterium]|nr:RIP metalloprotease RseP [Deferribacteraceae bacterium]